MSKGRNRLFALGVITGALTGYWLNSKQGKEVRGQAAEKVNEYGQLAGEYAQENAEKLKEKMGETLDQGKAYVNTVADKARSTYNKVAEKV